jgi:hypothetical protein
MTTFRTTAAYLSGGLCGSIWWPTGAMCGKPLQAELRGIFSRFSEPASFRDAFLHLLMREGGDFQSASFTADTVIRIERRRVDGAGKYTMHVKEIELSKLASDLVNEDAYVGDFMGEE